MWFDLKSSRSQGGSWEFHCGHGEKNRRVASNESETCLHGLGNYKAHGKEYFLIFPSSWCTIFTVMCSSKAASSPLACFLPCLLQPRFLQPCLPTLFPTGRIQDFPAQMSARYSDAAFSIHHGHLGTENSPLHSALASRWSSPSCPTLT